MTVKEFIASAKKSLPERYGRDETDQVLFLLLEDVKKFSRTDLLLRQDEKLSDEESLRLKQYLDELVQGRPFQYVVGHAWFCGMKFLVNEHVLIPRPETEELCEWLFSQISHLSSQISLLDIGTGSGCIAVAMKKKFPSHAVHAVDISADALEVVMQNAALNEAAVSFHYGDILSAEFRNSFHERFDVIVSNPPYVRKSEMDSMSDRVKQFEPHTALFVEDDDPLVFYRAISDFATTHLNENGKLFFEINPAFGEEIKALLQLKGFKNIELKKDLSGNDRMVMAAKNS